MKTDKLLQTAGTFQNDKERSEITTVVERKHLMHGSEDRVKEIFQRVGREQLREENKSKNVRKLKNRSNRYETDRVKKNK